MGNDATKEAPQYFHVLFLRKGKKCRVLFLLRGSRLCVLRNKKRLINFELIRRFKARKSINLLIINYL